MESERLPQQGIGWRTARGRVGIWTPGPTLMVMSLVGHGEGRFAAPSVAALARLSKHDRLSLFVDAEAMDSYDSPIRTELTAAVFPDRARYDAVHVLVRSKMVAMGVTVANLALGGIVHSHTERATFKAALDARLFESGIVGFSSGVLDGLQPGRVTASG